MNPAQARAIARFLVVAVPTLALATIAIGVLQDGFGVPNPSAIFLVAVVATAVVSGTGGAVATAIAAFLLYDFLFTEPRYTLTVSEPGVWISTALLLFVGVVVGQLTAMQRSRADVAAARERDARALYSVSRLLATRASTETVLTELARVLRDDGGFDDVVIGIADGDAVPRVLSGRARPGVINQLRRMPEPATAEWVRVHVPTNRPRPPGEPALDAEVYRVPIETGGGAIGSIWAIRRRSAGAVDVDETRLLAVTADQLGQALAHDRMAADARSADVARESDALKSALLQSVSHDLRSPLATIRAAAGTLRPGSGAQDTARVDSAQAIDREVEYLNRLVSNLLDLSRIEGGALHADTDTFELDDLVRATLDRLDPRLEPLKIENEIGSELVDADPVLFDAALTNVLENAVRHTAAGTAIRMSASQPAPATVRLTVEDSGAGVPDETLPRLFDKFFRVHGRRASRTGTGIGLAVARGLIEAMGGSIAAAAVYARRPRDRHRSRRRTRAGVSGPTVLVVEDDAETRAALVRELTARGYRIEEAADGRTALRRWQARRPDVVLLDLGLP